MRFVRLTLIVVQVLLLYGCRQLIIDRADRDVYRLIEDRQRAALGATSDVDIGHEDGEVPPSERMYSFNPRPVSAELPGPFRQPVPGPSESGDQATRPPSADVESPADRESPAAEDSPADEESPAAAESAAAGSPAAASAAAAEMSPNIFSEDELDRVVVFGLDDALAYAMRHARDLQDAKEDLYLAALDLTLERHLWTPQFVASVLADAAFSDGGEVDDEDRVFEAISEVSLAQRLAFGGEVTARVINSLVRDLDEHVTSAESGNFILEAQIPLFRGAGRTAYESRYTSERELIYAVRTYERFRRVFLVEVAARYLNLQQVKAAITNTYTSYQSRKGDWEKADFINRMGRSRTIFEAPRARSILRQSEAALVSAKEQYESALDQFKIFLSMAVDAPLDVVDQEADQQSKALDNLIPDIDQAVAAEVAVKYRLDLLNDADRVDDARRGVFVAKNRILPDLNITGGVTFDSDPDRLNSLSHNPERATYQGSLELRIDDRKSERNAYRASFVGLRRAERNHLEFTDSVRAEVRRALRRIAQQDNLRKIQELQVGENELRLEAARAQFDLGKSTNQDVVDAESDLLTARNNYARAVAAYRIALLDFRRDTGTLRVDDRGRLLPLEPLIQAGAGGDELADEP